jgi:hypothetical protein
MLTARTTSAAAHGMEAAAVASAGAVIGWLSGSWLHASVGIVMAAVAGVNGAVAGARGIYAWRRVSGWVAFVLDSSWAALPVAVSLPTHLAGRRTYVAALSRRRNHFVYSGGVALKPGFALTLGNVISGAGDVSRSRRAKLIEEHEAVHVWQARWFGPLYLPLYGLWAGLGALAGLVLWATRGRRQPRNAIVESCSYYMNPFEWWAYSRDDLWPPPGLHESVGWKRPAVRSFAERRR